MKIRQLELVNCDFWFCCQSESIKARKGWWGWIIGYSCLFPVSVVDILFHTTFIQSYLLFVFVHVWLKWIRRPLRQRFHAGMCHALVGSGHVSVCQCGENNVHSSSCSETWVGNVKIRITLLLKRLLDSYKKKMADEWEIYMEKEMTSSLSPFVSTLFNNCGFVEVFLKGRK